MNFEFANIRELVERYRGALAVLSRYGIDCCRSRDIALASSRPGDSSEGDKMLSEVRALPLHEDIPPTTARGLIGYLQRRYHQTHINKLFNALRLSWAARDERPDFPPGLPAHIRSLAELIEEHQEKENESVFPAILYSPKHNLKFPVFRVVMEHEEILDELDTIARLTKGYRPPVDASRSWHRSYALLAEIDGEVRFQIYLENTRLYSPFYIHRAAA